MVNPILKIKNLFKFDIILLGDYPYTYVRTLYLLSELIKKDDYHKLMKMSLPEITKYLEESAYKEEIDKLAVKYSGVALLENAFYQNTRRMFEKLKFISSDKVRSVIQGYSKRSDTYNLKTIIRGRFTNIPEQEIIDLLLPIGTLNMEHLARLIKKDSIKSILADSGLLNESSIDTVYKEFEKTNNLFEIENLLDKSYYSFLLSFSKRIKLRGKKFREFLHSEIYINNILNILRLKKANTKKNDIMKYLIFTGNKKDDSLLNFIMSLDSTDEIFKVIQKRDRGLQREFTNINTDSLIELELALKRFHLKKILLFQNKYPLSIDIVFAYLLGKEMEIRNLSLIVKGKQLGMNEKFIEEQLIV
jgi:V/A-type H+-transporting ATPase subunit C